MIIGDVFYGETDKAIGHASRNKYQLFIREPNWEEGYVFLFISSNCIEGDYKIENPPYSFLTKSESFVSCGSIISYDETELYKAGTKVGAISKAHMIEIHSVIASSFLMEQRHIFLVCNAIRHGCMG